MQQARRIQILKVASLFLKVFFSFSETFISFSQGANSVISVHDQFISGGLVADLQFTQIFWGVLLFCCVDCINFKLKSVPNILSIEPAIHPSIIS